MALNQTRDDEIVAAMRSWLERAVIGLNLCPFAKSVYVKEQIRYVVSHAATDEAVLDDLERELKLLVDTAPAEIDTTLLMLPDAFSDFEVFVRFLDLVEIVLRTQGLEGVLQVASFHPQYVFADTDQDDIANCTNRAPHPTLHLLREESLARATAIFPDAASIYERNIATMRTLGREGWQALQYGRERNGKA